MQGHLSDVEARTQVLGRALLEASARYSPGPAERVEDWLLTRAMADDRFRTRLLRYMDVLASLDFDSGGREAKRLAREYFGDEFPELPRPLRWLLRIARDEHLPAALVGETARRSAELFARRFITPPADETVRATIGYLASHDRYPSFDLLGEAVLSKSEASDYVDGYIRLMRQLARDPAAGARTDGGVAALQVSLKLSSLTHQFTALDPQGTLTRVREPLEAIVEAAERAGVGVAIDMEQYELRDLTWDIFSTVFATGERFGGWPDAGIVLQGYLRDAPRHATEMVEFARARGVPFQVRLVKGAYWDYERITAEDRGWAVSVLTSKSDTDLQFERLCATLIKADPHVKLAVGTHNSRAHAVAEALAEAAGLPSRAIEHQTLFRTAEGTSRALAEVGWAARDYVPIGELLPGMAYLVRRVIENSSQAGFLLQSRSGASAEELLKPPPSRPTSAPDRRPSDEFKRAPAARWFDASFRREFEAALASTRSRWGEDLGGESAVGPDDASEVVVIHSPSYPRDEPVGRVAFGSEAAAHRVVAAVRAGQPAWAATSPPERAAVLRRAASMLAERSMEFAAWVVHEGGRERAGAYAEVEEAIDFLNYYAAQAERLHQQFDDRLEARGVVAVIPPWNFSLAIPCGMTAAALVMGNSVVLKPAEQTPLIALRLTALLHEAGVPADVLAALPGDGEIVGRALVESPDVAMVAFTGSRAVGTWMQGAVSRVALRDGGVKTLVAEMGGKNAILVFADADLDEAVAGVLESSFGHANQKCSAASLVLVAAPIFERFRDRLVEAARSIAVGPADAPETELNPLIDDVAYSRLLKSGALARSECEVLLDRFEIAGDLQLGPLIVQLPADRALDTSTATEELFGPILTLIPFDDEATALRVANGSDYGLTAGVFTRSPFTVGRVSDALNAGNIYVNRATTGARVGIEPFGGMKMSGTGPKAGSSDYLWAFARRTDAHADQTVDLTAVEPSDPTAPLPELPACADLWVASLETRLAAIEGASVLLGQQGNRDAAALFSAAQAARRELGRPQDTIAVPGQQTELRYDTPRGLGLISATGPDAAAWLAAVLLAGNAAIVIEPARLEQTAAALLAAGVPDNVLKLEFRGADGLVAFARSPRVSFVAGDGDQQLFRRVWRELGRTVEGQKSLKALISVLDGPQPGEPGFVRRFAWPKVVAIRTLRHGADLALARRD